MPKHTKKNEWMPTIWRRGRQFRLFKSHDKEEVNVGAFPVMIMDDNVSQEGGAAAAAAAAAANVAAAGDSFPMMAPSEIAPQDSLPPRDQQLTQPTVEVSKKEEEYAQPHQSKQPDDNLENRIESLSVPDDYFWEVASEEDVPLAATIIGAGSWTASDSNNVGTGTSMECETLRTNGKKDDSDIEVAVVDTPPVMTRISEEEVESTLYSTVKEEDAVSIEEISTSLKAVSYTHLTLPTKA